MPGPGGTGSTGVPNHNIHKRRNFDWTLGANPLFLGHFSTHKTHCSLQPCKMKMQGVYARLDQAATPTDLSCNPLSPPCTRSTHCCLAVPTRAPPLRNLSTCPDTRSQQRNGVAGLSLRYPLQSCLHPSVLTQTGTQREPPPPQGGSMVHRDHECCF